jgi:hypothetical protein
MHDRKNTFQHFASAINKVIERGDPEEMAEKLLLLEQFAVSHPDLEVQVLAEKTAEKLRREM